MSRESSPLQTPDAESSTTRWVALAIVLAGCAGSQSPPSTRPTPQTCARLENEAAITLAPAASLPSPMIPDDLARGCVEEPSGIWWIRPRPVEIVDHDGEIEARCPFTVVHVTRDGTRLEASPDLFDESRDPAPCATDGEPRDGFAIAIVGTFDFDHDGTIELILESDAWARSGLPGRQIRILTVEEGAVGIYRPSEAIAIESVRDVDGDGRLDLISPAPYGSSCTDPLAREPCGGPRVVHHALPDGSFTDRDPVAIAALAASCADADPSSLPVDDIESSLRAVHCARIRGRSLEEVLETIEHALRQTPPPDTATRLALIEAAHIEPHLVLAH